MNKKDLKVLIKGLIREGIERTVRLYRGLEGEYDSNYGQGDAPSGYSTWTDTEALAREYAGSDGNVYYIDIPIKFQGDNYIDEDPTSDYYGDRTLFYFNDKKAGLHGVSGKEVLVYDDHEEFENLVIKKL
jgi:hypothetical protein